MFLTFFNIANVSYPKLYKETLKSNGLFNKRLSHFILLQITIKILIEYLYFITELLQVVTKMILLEQVAALHCQQTKINQTITS